MMNQVGIWYHFDCAFVMCFVGYELQCWSFRVYQLIGVMLLLTEVNKDGLFT